MAIEIGTYVSPELKEYINTYVDSSERKELGRNFDFSPELERTVLDGTRAITSRTHEYFILLIQTAIRNRTKKLAKLNKVHKELLKEVQ